MGDNQDLNLENSDEFYMDAQAWADGWLEGTELKEKLGQINFVSTRRLNLDNIIQKLDSEEQSLAGDSILKMIIRQITEVIWGLSEIEKEVRDEYSDIKGKLILHDTSLNPHFDPKSHEIYSIEAIEDMQKKVEHDSKLLMDVSLYRLNSYITQLDKDFRQKKEVINEIFKKTFQADENLKKKKEGLYNRILGEELDLAISQYLPDDESEQLNSLEAIAVEHSVMSKNLHEFSVDLAKRRDAYYTKNEDLVEAGKIHNRSIGLRHYVLGALLLGSVGGGLFAFIRSRSDSSQKMPVSIRSTTTSIDGEGEVVLAADDMEDREFNFESTYNLNGLKESKEDPLLYILGNSESVEDIAKRIVDSAMDEGKLVKFNPDYSTTDDITNKDLGKWKNSITNSIIEDTKEYGLEGSNVLVLGHKENGRYGLDIPMFYEVREGDQLFGISKTFSDLALGIDSKFSDIKTQHDIIIDDTKYHNPRIAEGLDGKGFQNFIKKGWLLTVNHENIEIPEVLGNKVFAYSDLVDDKPFYIFDGTEGFGTSIVAKNVLLEDYGFDRGSSFFDQAWRLYNNQLSDNNELKGSRMYKTGGFLGVWKDGHAEIGKTIFVTKPSNTVMALRDNPKSTPYAKFKEFFKFVA